MLLIWFINNENWYKLSTLEKKNTNFENDLKKILVEGSQDNHEKQLVEELTEEKGKNNTLAKKMKQLSQEFNELQRKNEDLERKIRQLEPGRSLADEFSEVNAKVATSTEAEYESRGIEASYNAPHKLDQKKMVDPSRKVKG